jgi:hypothetical protein
MVLEGHRALLSAAPRLLAPDLAEDASQRSCAPEADRVNLLSTAGAEETVSARVLPPSAPAR